MASKSSRSRPKASTSPHISDVCRAFVHAEPQADAPHYLGHRERLRERFLEGGAGALPDYELMELVLFAAIKRADTKPLAKRLLDKIRKLCRR